MLWKTKRKQQVMSDARAKSVKRRFMMPERLEARQLLAADPIHVGIVYLETDYLESDQDVGSDSRGDRFILSFNGGAPNTELTQVRISTDKDSDGMTVGDLIFDTELGGRGKNGAHPFRIVRTVSASGSVINAQAEVADGGTDLIINLSGFFSGDRLEFTIDLDEVLRNVADLELFNQRLDVIASGQEFQDSILNATFNAPHYETAHADSIFLNDYGSPNETHQLNLPPDEGTDIDSRSNRSAAAIGLATQVPKPISIAGQVWVDNNLNQVRDGGEKPLAGVAISLFKWDYANNRYVETAHRATSNADGQYLFPKALGIEPGRYRVAQTQPNNYYSVASIPGTVGGQQTGASESHDIITDIEIPLGDTDAVRFDFAEAQPASLSGYVYRDDNNDGRRTSNEPGIAGVRIQLVPINTIAPQAVITATTASDGSYHFTGIAPGTYEAIEVDQPNYLNDGIDTPGTINGVVVGRAVNPGDAIHDIVLAGGNEGIEYNFGETPFGSISGFVYLVAPGEDCNGVVNAPGNQMLEGVEVVLQDKLGTIISRTKTDANGRYEFSNMPIGQYRIVEYTPSGLLDGEAHVGRIDGVLSGSASGGGLIQEITMTANGRGVEYNFCEISPATISGFVYHDRSDDGVREANEEAIPNVSISLVDAAGKTVATTLSDPQGRYEFRNVVPGTYSLVEAQPANYYDGKDTTGTVLGTKRGSLGGDNDSLVAIELKQGEIGLNFNFGELLGATLSGRVHIDSNDNCFYDPGEGTPAGIEIRLIDSRGQEVAKTVTGVDGKYRFENIKPGEYTVIEGEVPGTFEGTSRPGSAGGVAEPPNRIGKITLASAEVAIDYDFCERPPAEISGVVSSDRDGDGEFDINEPIISDVVIELYNDSGDRIATARTDSNGRYKFSNLPAGQYTVREIQPTGWLQGGQKVGSHGGDDSVADVISSIPIGFGDRLTQYNFYEVEPGSISGVVYVDANADCVRDPDEAPIADVVIQLRDKTGKVVSQTTTDAQGRYNFAGLLPGEYQIFEQQPSGFFQGGQTVGSGGGQVLGDDLLGTILLAGANITEYNFCELPPGSISGYVYVDEDSDCERDPDEKPLSGVVIQLRDKTGSVISQTTTDALGRYIFDNLAPGEYQIFEQQPDGYFQGGQTVGSGGGVILGDDLLGTMLIAGAHITEYNFCELPPGSISGYVYVDVDGDCERDPDEKPLSGVVIQLRDKTGNVISQTTTDSLGRYRFDDLAPGEYQIFEQQPDGYFQGGQTVGSGGGVILGDDLLGTMLVAGSHLVEYNFCELPPASISGYVHVDEDGDCERDPGETPLVGVKIELRDDRGDRIGETVTDSQGMYHFANLPPGRYHIIETQPVGYFQGSQSVGSGGGDVIADDHLALDLIAGHDVVEYNFCELAPSSIAGTVWRETDLDRAFNGNDVAIGNVLIELLNDDGDVIAQTRTDSSGEYQFSNLAPGVYSVREIQPSGLFHGGQNVGSVGGEVIADDLISGIKLVGGTHGMKYDFPEVPPATISGYVFQDGDSIRANSAPDAKDLRQFRDGVFTNDDTSIRGVVLELRNVLGEVFTADRALDGVYPEGEIRVITDENGFYEFTGLRPGTYHVYQVQPTNFIDGLDTPGTTGGIAVNPADTVADDTRIIIQTLSLSEATNPRDDAILNISLSAGGASQNNNFSEIVIAKPPIPLQIDTPIEVDRPLTPIETFPERMRIVGWGDIDPVRAPMLGDDEWAVSWHLSVINGGYPGGKGEGDVIIKAVSAKTMTENWKEGEHTSGRWIIVNAQGEMMEISNRLTMGEKDAKALVGDFDGDGKDEAVLFVGGEWFVDMNGNGRWDKGDMWIKLGTELDRPVVGDWDGDGKDDVGIFGRQWHRDPQRIRKDPGLPDPENKRRREISAEELARHKEDRGEDRERWLRRGTQGDLRADAVDHVFQYGEQVDTPLAGDWNGDGIDQIAIYRGGAWMLDNDGDGRWTKNDVKAFFGQPGDEPIVGDFNGDEIDEIGIVRGDVWIIDTDGDRKITGNDLRISVPRNSEKSQPVVGDWDGDGKDEAGYFDEDAA